MKRFVFILGRILIYQQQNLGKEKGVLGKLITVRDELEKRKGDSKSIIHHIQEDVGKRRAQGTTVFILKGCHNMLEGVRTQLEETADELTQAQAKMEKQRSIVTEASKEVKKLKKLKEKQLEEYHHDKTKEQQGLIIEHVVGESVRDGVSWGVCRGHPKCT